MSSIIEKLEAIKARFDDLGIALTNPEIVADNKKFSQFFEGNVQIDPSLQKDNQFRILKGNRLIHPSTFSLDDEDDYDVDFVVESDDEKPKNEN